MGKSHLNRLTLAVLVLLLTLAWVPHARAEGEEPEATDLTDYIQFGQSADHVGARDFLTSSLLLRPIKYAPFEMLRLTWARSPKKPANLCIQWAEKPERVELQQWDADGNLLWEGYVESNYDTIVPLSEGTVSVTITADAAGMSLGRLALYSEGKLPAPFFHWQDPPHGMDYLVIATHPDDDTLFMGAIVPIYGAERGFVGTVAYVTARSRIRLNEAVLGARAMGTTYYPLFLGFQDMTSLIGHENVFLPETMTRALVRTLREYRPLVVFSHDQDGEYGNYQHKVVSRAVLDACRLCADPAYDPVSCEQFGTWEVKKCYLHLYPDNPLILDINTPLSQMDGRTAFEVAKKAFAMHSSQQGTMHKVQGETAPYSISRFGMAYGTVEAGDDAFDNIDPTLLSSYVPPEPEPTPTPEPAPTEAPTARPTAQPTKAPGPAATPVPEATAEPHGFESGGRTGTARGFLLPILCMLLGAAAAAGGGWLLRRRKKS